MKEVINNALLAEDKFMPQVILRQLGFGSSVFKPFTERKEKIITKKKQEVQEIFVKMDWIKLTFNTEYLKVAWRIFLEEQPFKKYWAIKNFILIKNKIWWISRRTSFNGLKFFIFKRICIFTVLVIFIVNMDGFFCYMIMIYKYVQYIMENSKYCSTDICNRTA